MADFCKQCNELLFGDRIKCGLAGLCKEGEQVGALCEECGHIWVDHTGKCLLHDREGPDRCGRRDEYWSEKIAE